VLEVLPRDEGTGRRGHDTLIAYFMASDPFLDHKPRKSPNKKSKQASGGDNKPKDSIGAFEARKNALEFVESSPNYIIFNDVKGNSMVPLGPPMLKVEDTAE
jgi:hypothetical protein